jgi:hypothetical protein
MDEAYYQLKKELAAVAVTLNGHLGRLNMFN